MKKQLLGFAALALTVNIASAQTEKGTQNIGLNLSYSSITNSNFVSNPGSGGIQNQSYKNKNFGLGPIYNIFIANNLDAGISLGYSNSNQDYVTSPAPTKQTSSAYAGTLFVRKYFLYDNKLGFRTGGRVGYQHSDDKYNYVNTALSIYDTEIKSNGVYGGLTLDLVYYPSKKIGLAATLANATYQHQKNDSGTQGTGNSNSFNVDLISSGLGLSVFFVFGGK